MTSITKLILCLLIIYILILSITPVNGDSSVMFQYVWNREGIRSVIYTSSDKEDTYSYLFNVSMFRLIEVFDDIGLCRGDIQGLEFWIPIENMSMEIPDEPYYLTRTCVKQVDILDFKQNRNMIGTVPIGGSINYFGHLNQYSLISYDGIMGFIDYRPPYLLGAFNPWQTEDYIPKGLFDSELATQMAKAKLISENLTTYTELENMEWELLYESYLIHSFIYKIRFYPEYPRRDIMYYVDVDAETGRITNYGYDEYPHESSWAFCPPAIPLRISLVQKRRRW